MISVFKPVSYAPLIAFNYSSESLTRDVDVKPIHSHNDYWRKRPLYDALSWGCASVEADVWIFENNYTVVPKADTEPATTRKFATDEVYVGHNQLYLEPNNTLWSLYLGPIYNLLNAANPQFKFDNGSDHTALLGDATEAHGLFYNSPETPLHLLVDVKTEANSTYQALKAQLQPFIDGNYLTYYDTAKKTKVPGPLMVTISGNQATQLVENETMRYVFLDSPLLNMNSTAKNETLEPYRELAIIASASLEQLLGDELYATVSTQPLGDDAKARLKGYFDTAHKLGLRARVWGSTTWPVHIRNQQMKDLWELGCDFVNADDLEYASKEF